LVEADEDTDVEVGDVETGPDAGGAAKSWRKTRSAVAKQSTTTAATAVSAEEEEGQSPPAVETPTIPTPQTREVKLEEEEEDEATEELPVVEDRPVRRSESPAAKRQREFVQKTTEDALRQRLETQRTAAAAQAMMPVLNRPRFFRPKPHVPALTR
jgi:hypothetical protein